MPNRFVYGATKAAVIGMTKSIAADFITQRHPLQRDLPGHGRVAVAARAHRGAGQGERPDARRRSRRRSSRASRWAASARTAEIAALAVYLASDESAFTTGTTQVIDGGWSN